MQNVVLQPYDITVTEKVQIINVQGRNEVNWKTGTILKLIGRLLAV